MTKKKEKKFYACFVQESGIKDIFENWEDCERVVKGTRGARYRSFGSREEAEIWLAAGAQYEKKESKPLEPGIYFDAGTGGGEGVEINVVNEKGESLIGGKKKLGEEVTNNYGELFACKQALTVALSRGINKVFGDSQLVIDFWSKGFIKKNEIDPETVKLSEEVAALRRKFEVDGGDLLKISGDYNPADLGYHR